MRIERLNRVMEKLEALGVSQMIISDPVSIFYLTDYSCDPGERLFAFYVNKNGGNKLFVNICSPYPRIWVWSWSVSPIPITM